MAKDRKIKREGMLPAHIFEKTKEKFNTDKIEKIFPQLKKQEENSEIIEENEELKKACETLQEEIEKLKEKNEKKIGTKKALVEEIEKLKIENEQLKADIDGLLNDKEEDDNDNS